MLTHLENETTLLSEAKAGNADAFVALLNQYDRHIYRLALHITSNREDAQDVLQESLLKAYANLKTFRGDSRFYSWLVRIAVNEALTKLRTRHSGISLDESIEVDDRSLMPREIEDWGDSPEKSCSKSELRAILDEVIEELEPQFRIVFILRDVEEISTEETAAMLGMSVPAVKSRLLRARLKLRARLSKRFKKG